MGDEDLVGDLGLTTGDIVADDDSESCNVGIEADASDAEINKGRSVDEEAGTAEDKNGLN